MRSQYATGVRNPSEITKAAQKRVRELVKNKEFYCQKIEYAEKKAKLRQDFKIKTASSKLENIMRAHLIAHSIEFIEEYAAHIYNFDFYIPSLKCVIECNSGGWHLSKNHSENDAAKKRLISERGWALLINQCPLCRFNLFFEKNCVKCLNPFKTMDNRKKYCSQNCFHARNQ